MAWITSFVSRVTELPWIRDLAFQHKGMDCRGTGGPTAIRQVQERKTTIHTISERDLDALLAAAASSPRPPQSRPVVPPTPGAKAIQPMDGLSVLARRRAREGAELEKALARQRDWDQAFPPVDRFMAAWGEAWSGIPADIPPRPSLEPVYILVRFSLHQCAL